MVVPISATNPVRPLTNHFGHAPVHLCCSVFGHQGLTENDGHEDDDEMMRHEIAGHEIARHLAARSDTPHSNCLQVSVAPMMWKASQLLQQVMPWPLADRRRHLRRSWTRRGAAAERQCAGADAMIHGV